MSRMGIMGSLRGSDFSFVAVMDTPEEIGRLSPVLENILAMLWPRRAHVEPM